MQALVKTPLIEITAKGEIPKKVLAALKKEFGNDLEINDDDELVDITTTDWYKEMQEKRTPGSALKAYRSNRGFSQGSLASELGITPANVSDMENGRRGISKEMAKKLSKVLKAPVERFL
jgi:DNA-binding XRE family transcriptional regulator